MLHAALMALWQREDRSQPVVLFRSWRATWAQGVFAAPHANQSGDCSSAVTSDALRRAGHRARQTGLQSCGMAQAKLASPGACRSLHLHHPRSPSPLRGSLSSCLRSPGRAGISRVGIETQQSALGACSSRICARHLASIRAIHVTSMTCSCNRSMAKSSHTLYAPLQTGDV